MPLSKFKVKHWMVMLLTGVTLFNTQKVLGQETILRQISAASLCGQNLAIYHMNRSN